MDISLAILLTTIGASALVTTVVVFTNVVTRTKNVKLNIEVNSLDKRLKMEKIKNQELVETLDYIRDTGLIPEKVRTNKYEYQNLKSLDPSIPRDQKLQALKDKFKVKLSLNEDEKKLKEEAQRFMESQKLNKMQQKQQINKK